jgi:hypothetical protein
MPTTFNPVIPCVSTLLEIQGNDCIGDTREAINDNVRYLGTAICNLSSQRLVPSTSTTIQHTVNNSSRVLTSEIRDNSITETKIALSAVTTNKIALNAVTADRINLVTSLSTNGYQIMPGGLIMQWGLRVGSLDDTNATVNFPITFPNNCLNVQVTLKDSNNAGSSASASASVQIINSSSFRIYGAGISLSPEGYYWQAIGY